MIDIVDLETYLAVNLTALVAIGLFGTYIILKEGGFFE